jgi:hypothetical protein
VQVYPSIKAAARCAGVWPSQMQRLIRRGQVQEGCVWRFSEDGAQDAEAREGRGGEEEVGWGREEGVEGMEKGEGAEEEEEKDTECSVCGKRDVGDRMLLCDGCDRGWHLFCLDPPLENVPHGAWCCPVCIQGGGGGAESAAAQAAEAERHLALDGCYLAKEDETPRMIAKMLRLDVQCLIKLNKPQFPTRKVKPQFPTLKVKCHQRKATLLRVPSPGDLDMFIPASTLDERAEGRGGGGEEAKEAAAEPLKISGVGGKKAGCARVNARGRGVESVDMLQVGPDA